MNELTRIYLRENRFILLKFLLLTNLVITIKATKATKIIKIIKIIIVTLALNLTLVLTSCSFPIHSSLQDKQIKQQPQLYQDEVIRYIGYPMHQGQRQKGIVISADQYSYLISDGYHFLADIVQLPTSYIKILQPIKIYKYPDNSVKVLINFQLNPVTVNSPLVYVQSSVKPTMQPSNLKYLTDTEHKSIVNIQQALCRSSPQSQLSTFQLASKTDKKPVIASNTVSDTVANIEQQSPVYNCQLQLKGGAYQAINHASHHFELDKGLKADIIEVGSKQQHIGRPSHLIRLSVAVEIINIPAQLFLIGDAIKLLK